MHIHVIIISIGQSSKMATWPPLQHNWPWPIAIYRAIDTREAISIECHLLLQQFSLELETLIVRVDQQNREKVSCKCDVALERYCSLQLKIQCIVEMSLSNTEQIDFATTLSHSPNGNNVKSKEQKTHIRISECVKMCNPALLEWLMFHNLHCTTGTSYWRNCCFSKYQM